MAINHPALKETPFLSVHLANKCINNTVLVWGEKPLSRVLGFFAKGIGKKVTYCEDGFVSYIGHPATGSKRLSLLLDSRGCYYNRNSETDLEVALKKVSTSKEDEVALQRFLESGVTKYNTRTDHHAVPLENSVVIVDQVLGDMSLRYGCKAKDVGKEMLRFAISLVNPDEEVYLKLHPDSIYKNKKGLFSELNLDDFPQVRLIQPDENLSVLSKSNTIITATSQFGAEALLRGAKVHCFGVPFYSHWGLTTDHDFDEKVWVRRGQKRELTRVELFKGALCDYPSYVNPMTGRKTTLSVTIQLVIESENNTNTARTI
ncbi:hypothetical protein [Vibrio crassostreae]|uniref:capsular polysaccharide export protein, LipB/KpsS family n=1 Tax=Vibrio crassostreae TaxID=246167 RepID=UPI001B309BF4|nr:hypothetical protein [Vibrio crassostreae]